MSEENKKEPPEPSEGLFLPIHDEVTVTIPTMDKGGFKFKMSLGEAFDPVSSPFRPLPYDINALYERMKLAMHKDLNTALFQTGLLQSGLPTADEVEKTLDKLFPAGDGDPQPLEWFRFEGGLTRWQPEVHYYRWQRSVQLRLKFNVPSSSLHKKTNCQCNACFGKGVPEPGRPMDLFGQKTFYFRDWQGRTKEQIVQDVMNYLRGIFLHEVLEGLIVENKIFYAEEVATYH